MTPEFESWWEGTDAYRLWRGDPFEWILRDVAWLGWQARGEFLLLKMEANGT